jgi:glyoxylase-like metal-dependent hydrolase (beta-lactamase superfamily II)
MKLLRDSRGNGRQLDLFSLILCGVISAAAGTFFPMLANAQTPIPVVQLGPDLEIREVLPQAFVVTHSYPWPANSMFVLVGNRHVVFVDTPYTPEATTTVLDWIARTFGDREILAINTGFHFDNLGGNQAFLDRHIPIMGSDRTVELIKERGEEARQLFLQWLSAPKDRLYHDRYIRFDPGLIANTVRLLQ